ncbi:MAG: DAK2 domain-containing protein [Actinomycetia bacterium]|nr:DAK2 domain-containing protein [Actinomycetes bacterium]
MEKRIEEKVLEEIADVVIFHFKKNESKINDMNVFPVPDGDTGTNMLLTLRSIKEGIMGTRNPTIKSILENASMGALMGARGNSGVILSQIVGGFFEILIKSEQFDLDTIREALRSSRDVAYGSVQNPTEGTMLTTIKDICSHVEEICEDDKVEDMKLEKLLDSIIEEAEKSVERTIFLLPVLKQANVVDAGARGILEILIGIRHAFSNHSKVNGNLKMKLSSGNGSRGKKTAIINKSGSLNGGDGRIENIIQEGTMGKNRDLEEVKLTSEIKYTYCTELVVKGSGINIERLREKIESYGDSALIVGNENLVKIHVHTNSPQKVLNRAMRAGSLHDIQINNMKDQRLEIVGTEAEKKEAGPAIKRAHIVVSNGEGLEEIFKSIGVDIILSGGQSMNPSTYDIVKAINSLDAAEILIFPNNKNIILTANQAKKLVKKKTITVVPTRTIPEGISAVLSYNPDAGMEENAYNMGQAIKMSKSGEITRAVRDAKLHVGEIKKGAYIGLFNGEVKIISDDIIDAATDLIRDMLDGNEEVITFYTGKEADSADIKALKEKVAKLYPKIDLEIHKGGQPLYPFIFSIE